MALGPAIMARTQLSLSETGGFGAQEGQKSSQALPRCSRQPCGENRLSAAGAEAERSVRGRP